MGSWFVCGLYGYFRNEGGQGSGKWIKGRLLYLYYFWNLFTYASQVPGGAAGDDLLRVLRIVGTCSLGAFCS